MNLLSAVGSKAEYSEMERGLESPGEVVCRHLQSSTTVQGRKSLAGDGEVGEKWRAVGHLTWGRPEARMRSRK